MIDKAFSVILGLRPNVPRTLYHYCSAESIKYLVNKDSDIWCTHCNFLNDPEECWTAQRCFISYLEKRNILPTYSINVLRNNMCQNSLFHKYDRGRRSKIMPFTFSFSEKFDDGYFWDKYVGGTGGYCVAFDGEGVEQISGKVHSILSQLDPKNRFSLYLAPCFYEQSDAQDISTVFDAIVEGLHIEFDELARNPNGCTHEGIKILSTLASISPLIKSEDWHKEKEWRLVMMRENFERIVWRDNRARSYMSVANGGLRSLIKEIKCSPQGDLEWLRNNLEYELNDGFRGSDREFV